MGVAVSENGTLTYHEGEFAGGGRGSLQIVRDDGTVRSGPGGDMLAYAPRVSPDGQRILVESNGNSRVKPEGAIVLFDVRTGALQRVVAEGEGISPRWSRDGRRVDFLRFLGVGGR